MKRYQSLIEVKENKKVYSKSEAMEFFKKLPTKNMRKFKNNYSRKEFGDFSRLIMLSDKEFYNISGVDPNSFAFFRTRDFTIYVNAAKLKKEDFTAILLHELAHTRNWRFKKEELINEINMMRVKLVKDNFWGNFAYSINDNIYDLQELHSQVYVRYKMMGYIV